MKIKAVMNENLFLVLEFVGGGIYSKVFMADLMVQRCP